MCQLLGMNCNVPTDICFSFEGFRARGGETDHHKDGWGIAFFENHGCRLFIDSKATIDSPLAELVRSYPIRSTNVIAHIRKATQGRIALENCHPFMREMWGQYWLFAHNGDLGTFNPGTLGIHRPVGTTDSERAFCYLLEALRKLFPSAPPTLPVLHEAIRNVSVYLAQHGEFNYLLSNGEYLFAHCSTQLSYLVRQSPFTHAHLVDQDITVDFSHLAEPDDKVAVIATQPLTDNETWIAMSPGELKVFQDGTPVLL